MKQNDANNLNPAPDESADRHCLPWWKTLPMRRFEPPLRRTFFGS
jgi:hypothetical protein